MVAVTLDALLSPHTFGPRMPLQALGGDGHIYSGRPDRQHLHGRTTLYQSFQQWVSTGGRATCLVVIIVTAFCCRKHPWMSRTDVSRASHHRYQMRLAYCVHTNLGSCSQPVPRYLRVACSECARPLQADCRAKRKSAPINQASDAPEHPTLRRYAPLWQNCLTIQGPASFAAAGGSPSS